MSTAVNIFLRQAVMRGGLPFDVVREVPNAETLAAIEEVKEMEAHPEKYKGYKSIEELRAALEV
jgi:DNA-damage-inducible protein J